MSSIGDSVPSPFDTADPSFVLAMLDIGGRLLEHVANGTGMETVLEDLCSSMCSLLDAGLVTLTVVGEPAELGIPSIEVGGAESARGDGSPDGVAVPPASVHEVEIRSPAGDQVAMLHLAWSGPEVRPTMLDRVVADRFAEMAAVVIDRHLARRHQLRAIVRDREATAGEIHDDPIQTLTAVSLQLRRACSHLPAGEARDQVEGARILTDQTIERLRHVMFSLFPETLAEDGLTAALDDYCHTYLSADGLRFEVEGESGDEAVLEVSALAFRLARVALTNVVSHAHASVVLVTVKTTEARLRVTVADDGIGFDTATLGRSAVGHYGVPHARALAQWAGGGFTVGSRPGEGCTVVIDLPRN